MLTPILMVLRMLVRILVPLRVTGVVSMNVTGKSVDCVVRHKIVLITVTVLSLFFNMRTKGVTTITTTKCTGGLQRSVFCGIRSFSFGGVSRFSASNLIAQLAASVAGMRRTCVVDVHLLTETPFVVVLS